MGKHRTKDPLAWGIILIFIGIVFLFDNLRIGVWDFAARLWPLILIFWGGWKLYFGFKEKEEAGKKQD